MSTATRGYGRTHQLVRQQLAPHVAAGLAVCSRCGKRIQPGVPWDLDHTDDRSGYAGPAHRRCNRSAGGTHGAQATNQQRRQQPTSARW